MVTVVMPTFNRLVYLQQTLSTYLAQPQVREIIVVDDGSTDGTDAWVRALSGRDRRVRLIRHDTKRGAPAARNSGVTAATGEWILFGEDDVILAPDYVTVLVEQAERLSADVVAGPLIYLRRGETPVEAVDRWRNRKDMRVDEVTWFRRLTLQYSFGPQLAESMPTPFLHACSLSRRRVFAKCRHDEGYQGNGYREETAFYLSAEEAGFRLYYTPAALCFHLFVNRQGGGGQWNMSRWDYERWAIRNNNRFLRLHYAYLKNAHGYSYPKWLLQAAFVSDRLVRFVRGQLSGWRRSIWPA